MEAIRIGFILLFFIMIAARFLEWLNLHDNLPIHSPLLNKEPYFNAKYTEKGLIIEELHM